MILKPSRLLLAVACLGMLLSSACAPASKYKPHQAEDTAQTQARLEAHGEAPAAQGNVPGPAPLFDEEFAEESGGTEGGGAEPERVVADPLEPFNRLMFEINDKLYFYLLKPVARGYGAVVPEGGRIGVRNFFRNVTWPIRYASCLLQLRWTDAQRELARFIINTTAGGLGFFDVAQSHLDLKPSYEDLGQTFGSWGIDNGFYIVWPVLGPSTLRDTVGFVGDGFVNPINYLDPWYVPYAVKGYDRVNDTSLRIGEYESLKEASLDPYTALRSGYIDYRWQQVRER